MSPTETFWNWAARTYARPGAEASLLALQDDRGHSVPYLLWAAWMAAAGRWPPDSVLIDGAARARGWDAGIVSPLRQVRRRLDRGDLRDQVKAAELAAEQALMAALEALAPSAGQRPALDVALAAAAEAWSPGADAAPVKLLATVLG